MLWSPLTIGSSWSARVLARSHLRIGPRTVFVLMAGLAAGGCASARLTQFHAFAEAGSAYVKASQVVLDEAGTAAIDADSVIVLKAREALERKERGPQIIEHDKQLRIRLLLLKQIGRHGRLLEAYFEALRALADSDAPETAGLAAQGVFDSIAKLSPTIQDASIGSVAIRPLIPPATSFVVRHLKVKALENELKARSEAIERELALQEGVLTAVASTLETDLVAKLENEETELVGLYRGDGILSDAWVERRRRVLQARVASQSAGRAAEAAAQLRSSFVALVEHRLTEPSIQQILTSINSVLDLIDQIRAVESHG